MSGTILQDRVRQHEGKNDFINRNPVNYEPEDIAGLVILPDPLLTQFVTGYTPAPRHRYCLHLTQKTPHRQRSKSRQDRISARSSFLSRVLLRGQFQVCHQYFPSFCKMLGNGVGFSLRQQFKFADIHQLYLRMIHYIFSVFIYILSSKRNLKLLR